MLVDTGAAVSVLPATGAHRRQAPIWFLTAVNNTGIPVFGQKSLTLELGLRRQFTWLFTIASVSQPILGADFLERFGLMVDLARRRLVDSATSLAVHGIGTFASPQFHTEPLSALASPYADILKDFPSLTQPTDWSKPVKHDVVHKIITSGQPVSSRFRRLAPEKLAIAKRIPTHDRHRRSQAIIEQLGVTVTHGPQEDRGLETMW
ncbi:uncharacterized protein LOC135392311 [Ornithodoros turicata]|uniref:uncharacterized protein LOC135392311 n=1 Tax=Ornithodoros turicata TaxID=34597 RepID=UPI003138A385